MPLQRQIVTVPLAQGIDGKTDPKQVQPGKLLSLSNGVFTTKGQLRKRYAYTARTAVGATSDSIYSFRNEILVGSSGHLQSYLQTQGTWSDRGALPRVTVTRRGLFRGGASVTIYSSAVSSIGTACYVHADYNQDATINYGLFATVVDDSTGVVLATTAIGTPGAVLGGVAVNGAYFLVTYLDGGNASAAKIDAQTGALAATITWGTTDGRTPATLATGSGATARVYAAWTTLAGVETLRYVDNTFALSAPATITGLVSPIAYALGLDTTNGNILVGAVQAGIYFAVMSPALAVVQTGTAVDLVSTPSAQIAIGTDSAGHPRIWYGTTDTWTGRPAAPMAFYSVKSCVLTGYAAGTPGVLLRNVCMETQPWVSAGTTYLVVAAYSGGSGRFVINALTGAVVARFALNYGSMLGTVAPSGFTNGTLNLLLGAVWNPVGQASTFSFPFQVLHSSSAHHGAIIGVLGLDVARVTISSSPAQGIAATLGDTLLIADGRVSLYDGAHVTEQGFNHDPGYINSSTNAAGGSIEAGVYQYVGCYRWVDATGAVHRSAPSILETVEGRCQLTTTGATSTNTIKIQTLRITDKTVAGYAAVVELYRTLKTGGTIFYLLQSVPNEPTVDQVTFTDKAADSTILGNEQLYTTGGVLDTVPAPPFSAVTIYRNRLVGISSEFPNQVWFSKQTIPGQPVEFSDLLILNMDPVGGDNTALAALDDKLLIFKPGVVYYITGNGWDSTGGANDLTTPILINTNSGCVEPRSVTTAGGGCFYQSQKGIYLLDRALVDHYVGAEVEPFNSYPVLGVVAVPNTNEVRFMLGGGALGLLIVYDYLFQQWSVHGYIAGVSTMVAIGVSAGVASVLRSTGVLYYEDPTAFVDTGAAYYPLAFKTGWIGPGDLQSFLRIYKLMIVGEWKSNHILTVKVRYDYDDTTTDTYTITALTPSPATYQYRVNLARQKCEAIQVEVSVDALEGVVLEGCRISALSFEVGQKSGPMKLPAARQA